MIKTDRVLILGASGYVGSVLTRLLASPNRELGLYSRSPLSTTLAGNHETFSGELAKVLPQLLRKKWDAALFLISMDHSRSGVGIEETLRTNVALAWETLEALAGNGLGRWLYFSTQQVYGPFGSAIAETVPANPVNAYGLTHRMVEEITSLYHRTKKLTAVSLRLSNLFGRPGTTNPRHLRFAVLEMCQMAWTNSVIRLRSDGSAQRDLISTQDLAGAVNVLLTAPSTSLGDGVFNLGSGSTYAVAELAKIVAERASLKLGRPVSIETPDGTLALSPASRFAYDVSRLKALGYRPKCDLVQGIDESLDYVSELASRGHVRSFADTNAASGLGQSMPTDGSSQSSPRADSGA